MERTYPLLKKQIDLLLTQNRPVTIAIDGNCAAGKTTLAQMLAQVYDCNVFHMDDYFLRPQQRTTERYAQAGGNVDYERFMEEVLIPLKAGQSFSYRPFDCSTFTLTQPVAVTPKLLNIVEGTYSHHPHFGNPYDLKIFLTVSTQTQRQQILCRPAFLHQRFFDQWIPMEHRYFDTFQIREKADIILTGAE